MAVPRAGAGQAGGPPAKKAKKAVVAEAAAAAAGPGVGPVPNPEDLEEGTPVVYWGEFHGFVRDAYVPLDEFWITDAETGQIVRDENGDIVQFHAGDLQLLAKAGPVTPGEEAPKSGVMLVGREEQMVKILEHFGAPDTQERRSPQQLLAIPCTMCDPNELPKAASEGVQEEVQALARKLRPDIHVGVRAAQLKQVVERIGPDLLRLDGFYILAGVQLPFPLEAAEADGLSAWEKHRRKELCNQIDLVATAITECSATDSPEAAARIALGETCGIELSDMLWEDKVQLALRRRQGVELATRFEDSNGMHVAVVLLPDDAVPSTFHGMLCFTESPDADYEALATRSSQTPAPATSELPGKPAPPVRPATTVQAAASQAAPAGGSDSERQIQGKTIREWEAEQQREFAHAPKLPPGWLRIKSRKTGEVYYFNKRTQEATFEFPEAPLPDGWSKQVSKSTGKTYYFHAKRKVSTFERPTA